MEKTRTLSLTMTLRLTHVSTKEYNCAARPVIWSAVLCLEIDHSITDADWEYGEKFTKQPKRPWAIEAGCTVRVHESVWPLARCTRQPTTVSRRPHLQDSCIYTYHSGLLPIILVSCVFVTRHQYVGCMNELETRLAFALYSSSCRPVSICNRKRK